MPCGRFGGGGGGGGACAPFAPPPLGPALDSSYAIFVICLYPMLIH